MAMAPDRNKFSIDLSLKKNKYPSAATTKQPKQFEKFQKVMHVNLINHNSNPKFDKKDKVCPDGIVFQGSVKGPIKVFNILKKYVE